MIENNTLGCPAPDRLTGILVVVLLTAAAVLVYAPVKDQDYIFDDLVYVQENKMVRQGLTLDGLKWAFTDSARLTWQPVTWLSFMLDYELFGQNPGASKIINLVLHISCGLLLLLFFHRASGNFEASFLLAGLFLLHPTNVETVAWISQRKNLLSAVFGLLALCFYQGLARRPNLVSYFWVALFFALGLMAKPSVVALPFVLLFLDFWPLGRLNSEAFPQWTRPGQVLNYLKKSNLGRLILEKIPLLIMAVLLPLILIIGDFNASEARAGRALGLRLSNAAVTYVEYIGKVLAPADLSFWYDFPEYIPWWQPLSALVLLGLISLLAVRFWKQGWLLTGWCWYLLFLFPACGLVQSQTWPAMAYHHLYLPGIGLFIMAAWGLNSLAPRLGLARSGILALSLIFLTGLAVTARWQVGHWQTPATLWNHAASIEPNSPLVRFSLGRAYQTEKKNSEALKQYKMALRVRPRDFRIHNNMGNCLLALGRPDEAARHFRIALDIQPDYIGAHMNLGHVYLKRKDYDQAMKQYTRALKLDPDYAKAYYNLGLVLAYQGKIKAAASNFQKAVDLEPNFSPARSNLKKALSLLDQGAP